MTHASASPVTREMLAVQYERGRNRSIIARLEGGCIKLRLKGTRRWYTVAVASVWMLAMRAAVQDRKKERAAARAKRNAV